MSITRTAKPPLDGILLNLIGLVEGLWESAFILNREWKKKESYAKEVLDKVGERIKEINTDHREFVLVKDMEQFYQPGISFEGLRKYVSMIKKGKYKKALVELDEIGERLREIWGSSNRRGYLSYC